MKCIECKNNKFINIETNYVYSNTNFKNKFSDLKCVKCLNCGLIQVYLHEPIETANSKLNDYYRTEYRSDGSNTLSTDSEKWYRNRGRAIAKVARELIYNDKIVVFEFGAGYGINLDEMSRVFSDAQLYTNEVNKFCSEFLNQKNVQICDIGEIKDPIDFVIMSHVLEHLLYPSETILDISKRLNKDGILYIEVPNNVKYNMRFFEPHVSFWSEESLYTFYVKFLKDEFELVDIYTTGASLEFSIINSKLFKKVQSLLGYTGVFRKIFQYEKNRISVSNKTKYLDFSKKTKNGIFLKMILRKK